ncbi:hypothetical protein LBMAG42_34010 [Deltaproteobacteria bacterium]|nr:hypothetical protein LBMAG42_34010 [Deltaproteobacteria bacterium]
MANWLVSSATSSVCAEGGEWLDALASALPHFKFAPGTLGQLSWRACQDGTIDVFGPGPRQPLWLHVEPFPSAGEMFTRCGEIFAASDAAAASTVALNLLRDSIPAEAGAVLLTTREASQMQFVSAFGPKADHVLGMFMPANVGVAGFVTSFPTGTILRHAQQDCRFYAAVDRASMYHTDSMLAVPITTRDSPCFGCLELLNAPERFHARDLPMAQTIASALAAWLLLADA